MLVCSSSVTLVEQLMLQLHANQITAVVPSSLYDRSRVGVRVRGQTPI